MFMLYELQVAAFVLFIFIHSHATNDDVAADADDLNFTGWHVSLKA